jgi:hypothetical protein
MKLTETNMEEKELKAEDIPWGYPRCFNGECADKEKCMHHQAGLLLAEGHYYGPAVYPIAWQEGHCHCFCEKKLIEKAWGFKKLYNNVPKYLRAEARKSVHSYLGSGMSAYYRIHNGEKMLSPRQQEDIISIIAQYGNTDGIRFDHYVTDWNFE